MLCKHEVVGSIPSGSTRLARSQKQIAVTRSGGCVDIVKEEFDRPVHRLRGQVREDIVWQVKPGVGPADTSFHPPGSLCMGFAEKRSSVEGLLTDALA